MHQLDGVAGPSPDIASAVSSDCMRCSRVRSRSISGPERLNLRLDRLDGASEAAHATGLPPYVHRDPDMSRVHDFDPSRTAASGSPPAMPWL
jgi:hypothetical protein